MTKINLASYFQAQGYGKEQYQYIKNPPEMNDKWRLNDIKKAIQLIDKASKITIIGDYDTDGITATTIAYLGLKRAGKNVEFYVPNRFTDGYGLNINLVKKAHENGSDTILTVDNGIAAYDAIKAAKDEYNMTVIVTDHHNIKRIPPADAIVHPAMGNYPFANISGCQVAYKLIMALFETHDISDEDLERYFLQLSSISIVSDVMPIASINMDVNENRKWLIDGLNSLNKAPDQHFVRLARHFDFMIFDETVLGFYIIPCINAVGRLADATFAVNYFICNDRGKIYAMASKMYALNEKRKELVDVQLRHHNPVYSPEKKAVFVVGDDIHEGIAGLIAGKHSSGLGTVSFCFTRVKKPNGDVFYKGSGRNDTSAHLIEDILNCIPEGIIVGYGGHKDACGLSIKADRMNDFIRYAGKFADEKAVSNVPYIIDTDDESFLQVSKLVRSFKPFGNGFTAPVINTDVRLKNIMTTLSGCVKVTGVIGDTRIDIWLREADSKLYERLESIKDTKTFPTGAVTYYLKNEHMNVTMELAYTPKKTEQKFEMSYNGLKADFA